MGQYRQWLHHREIDQLLRAQLVTLEHELAQLNERINAIEQETELSADNAIFQALFQQQQATRQAVGTTGEDERSSTTGVQETEGTTPGQTGIAGKAGTVSPALFAWGSLPNFDSQDMPHPLRAVPTPSPLPPSPRPEEDLLPSDMAAFVDIHSQTAPQLKLPWWLRSSLRAAERSQAENANTDPGGPVDLQSSRTNQLVQRWFERRRRFAQQSQERRGQESRNE